MRVVITLVGLALVAGGWAAAEFHGADGSYLVAGCLLLLLLGNVVQAVRVYELDALNHDLMDDRHDLRVQLDEARRQRRL